MTNKNIVDKPDFLRISGPESALRGTISLDGSKSISNRALIILALAQAPVNDWLSHLSTAQDTQTLQKLLTTPSARYDAGDAGTTFRFLCAYLAIQPGEQVLTGSARMLERPIGPLVDALRSLGADISYLGETGFPPLRIGTMKQKTRAVSVEASVSSQFLSALLLIGPYLPLGLQLVPTGPLVSRPYLEMTISLMRHFGADVRWENDTIIVAAGPYTPKHLLVEADWSAASYWYAMASLAPEAELTREGLHAHSWQGDAVLTKKMQRFDIQTTFGENKIHLSKSGHGITPVF